jgi:hypothetical protein
MNIIFQKAIKIIFLMAFLLLVQYSGFSQKCHYEVNDVDAFTQMPIKRTNPEAICRINNYPVYVKAQCIGEHKYLKLRYYKYNDFVFQENEPIIFLLSNHEQVELTPRNMPERTVSGGIEDVSALLVYKLSPEQFEKLLSLSVVKFKYPVSTGYMEKEIKGKKQLRISKILRCVQ